MTRLHENWILVPGGIIALTGILLWIWGAQPSSRPQSMPVNSIWIDAPNVPFGWHHGWWFGCGIGADGYSDYCLLWSAGQKNPIAFVGQYVSCQTHSSVPADELKLKAPPDSAQMWVGVTSGEIIAPAAFLQNGDHLVPVDAPRGCEELQKNLSR